MYYVRAICDKMETVGDYVAVRVSLVSLGRPHTAADDGRWDVVSGWGFVVLLGEPSG